MIVLLFTLFAFSSPTQENHDDIITKARTLVLQRDRDKALQLLQLSVDRESNNPSAVKKLIKAMTQMGEMIFTERGQQMLESAESLVLSEPSQAIEQYKEALKIESGNLLIEARLTKAYLLLEDCGAAAEQAEGILQTHPWHEIGLYLYAQAMLCKSSSLTLKEKQAQYIADEKIKYYVNLAQALLSKDYDRIIKEAELAIKKFPDFSEFYWFKAEALKAQKKDPTLSIAKYMELCKASSSTLLFNQNLLYFCKQKEKP